MPVLIRPMQPEDIPVLVSLEQSAFSDPWSEKAFAEELNNPYGITLVAEQDGVAGYLNAHHVLENVHINTFCVAPQRRRQGIGLALLQLSLIHILSPYSFVSSPSISCTWSLRSRIKQL